MITYLEYITDFLGAHRTDRWEKSSQNEIPRHAAVLVFCFHGLSDNSWLKALMRFGEGVFVSGHTIVQKKRYFSWENLARIPTKHWDPNSWRSTLVSSYYRGVSQVTPQLLQLRKIIYTVVKGSFHPNDRTQTFLKRSFFLLENSPSKTVDTNQVNSRYLCYIEVEADIWKPGRTKPNHLNGQITTGRKKENGFSVIWVKSS